MTNERKEPTVSSVLSSPEDLADHRRSLASSNKSDSAPDGEIKSDSTRSPHTRVQSSREEQRKGGPSFAAFTFFLTLLALAATGYLFWQLQLSQQSVVDQKQRISELEKQLTVSGDTASQSLASVSVKVNMLLKKIETSVSEIDKLWAARNTNVSSIKKATSSLNKTKASLKKALADQEALKQSFSQSSQLISEQELLIQSLRERVADQRKATQSLSASVKKNASTAKGIQSFESRLKESEESLRSLEAFRRNVNRDILQLKAGSSVNKAK